jgi:hypothetical protein
MIKRGGLKSILKPHANSKEYNQNLANTQKSTKMSIQTNRSLKSNHSPHNIYINPNYTIPFNNEKKIYQQVFYEFYEFKPIQYANPRIYNKQTIYPIPTIRTNNYFVPKIQQYNQINRNF